MSRRRTEAERLEGEVEQAALAAFESALGLLRDPRRGQGRRYPLRSVVLSALLGCVCGADDAEAMAAWSAGNEEWLSTFLDLPHGTPSQDVYLRVFAALDPTEFQTMFRCWVRWLQAELELEGAHIAVDGKTARGSLDVANAAPAVHTVSAWAVDEGIVLGQFNTDAKSNEITAIPQLLKLMDLKGATVSIDAMGCQTAIAETIVARGGDYVFSAKDNQPLLAEEIEATFEDALDARTRPIDRQAPAAVEQSESVEKSHGRLETRTVRVIRDVGRLATGKRWKKLAFIAMVVRTREILSTGATTTETHYFIGSDQTASVDEIAAIIRGHWGIENGCHWVLDMAFHEDRARHRARNCARNFTTLRHFSLNLLKLEATCKLGIANKRKKAGWSRDYLLTVVAGPLS